MSSSRRKPVLVALTIAAATLAIYWQATGFAFVNYDDHRYVADNTRVLNGLTPGNMRWAFTAFEFSNWHPLTWISHMLDVSVHGATAAGGHHLTSIIVHAINAALLMLLMMRLTGAMWRSALVAALFALHPLHVESVAWVSERKDVLSTLFGLLAMLGYVHYARGAPRAARRAYVITIICSALSLMCKPMLVTLPFVLLLLDAWPLRRAESSRRWIGLILEKTPLMALSVASCIVTIAAQRAGGAVRDLSHIPLAPRLANALVSYCEYLWQTIWPANLAMFYPLPQDGWPAATVTLCALVLVAITLACLVAFHRGNRPPLFGWLWFLGTLVPVIGIVQVGAQSHADRYTYFPLIGLFIMLAYGVPRVPVSMQRLTAIAVAAALVALACVTYVQIGYWRDSMTLALHALNVTNNNFVAHMLLGNALGERLRFDEAIDELERARDIEPRSPQVWHNLGFMYDQAGRRADAIKAYQQAIALRPDFAENHYNLGLLLQAAGQTRDARAALQTALDLAARAGDDAVRDRAKEAMARLTLDEPNGAAQP